MTEIEARRDKLNKNMTWALLQGDKKTIDNLRLRESWIYMDDVMFIRYLDKMAVATEIGDLIRIEVDGELLNTMLKELKYNIKD